MEDKSNPKGDVLHIVHPAVQKPTDGEREAIRKAWLAGRELASIARTVGLSIRSVRAAISEHKDVWRNPNPPARPVTDARRIVLPITYYDRGLTRIVPSSLPRISMHVAILREAGHVF